jgi:hypothetical protein
MHDIYGFGCAWLGWSCICYCGFWRLIPLVVCCLSFMSAKFVILSWEILGEAWSMLVIPCWATTMMIYLNESMELW